jgi:polysaccharide biosynthesis/export protein
MRFWLTLLLAGLAIGCASEPRRTDVVAAAAVVDPAILASSGGPATSRAYAIGATDLLNITVFQVPDLSVEEVRVDASGSVQMPLIGSVRAAGLTPDQLADQIESELAGRFLQNPQVSITVSEAASQKVTVDGAVNKPGVYVMRGQTTLLQAVAMAEGPTDVANLRSVAVFRSEPAGRMVAVFDLNAIRSGEAIDPVLLGDDVVVVDTSRLSVATQRALQALPGLAAVFRYW